MPKLAPEFLCKVARVKNKQNKTESERQGSEPDDSKMLVQVKIYMRVLLKGINSKCFNNVLKFLSNKQRVDLSSQETFSKQKLLIF